MPQMSPMLWLFLSFFNLLNLFMLMIYLNSLPVIINMDKWSNFSGNSKINNMSVKWNWLW